MIFGVFVSFYRLRCHVIESSKPSSLTLKDNAFNIPAKTNEDLHIQVTVDSFVLNIQQNMQKIKRIFTEHFW